MSYDTKKDTITVNDVEYRVNREPDRGSPEETLTLEIYDVEQDEFVDAFPGLAATLGYEEYIEEWMSPRDACNVGVMSVSYNRYNLGDEDISKIDFEIECERCDGHGYFDPSEEECPKCEGRGIIEVNPAEYFIKERGARVVIGLFVYEHSGITMSAGPRVGEVLKQSDIRSTNRFMGDDAGWDTSFVGFIYDTPENLKECGWDGDNTITDEEIEKALRAEVRLYASYLEGDVTNYYVEDEETGFSEGCGGYVGEHKYTEEECFRTLESAIEARLAEEQERADMAARDIITKE